MPNFLIQVIILIVGTVSYFVPTIIAYRNKKAELPFIFIVNLFFGWTLWGYIWILLVSLNDGKK
jgi:Superinfection immunity protein